MVTLNKENYMTTKINLGYHEVPTPQNEKEARDVASFAMMTLDRIKHDLEKNDVAKTEICLSAMDRLKELFPEIFKLYDFASISNGDGTYHVVQGDAYVWFDFREKYKTLIS